MRSYRRRPPPPPAAGLIAERRALTAQGGIAIRFTVRGRNVEGAFPGVSAGKGSMKGARKP